MEEAAILLKEALVEKSHIEFLDKQPVQILDGLFEDETSLLEVPPRFMDLHNRLAHPREPEMIR